MQRLARPVLAACLTISACAASFGNASAMPFVVSDQAWSYGHVRSFDEGFEIGGVSAQTTHLWWSRTESAEFGTFIGLSMGRAFDAADLEIAVAPAAIPQAFALRTLPIVGMQTLPMRPVAASLHELAVDDATAPLRYHANASPLANTLPAARLPASDLFAALPQPNFTSGAPDADARRLAQHFAQLHAADFGQVTFDGVTIATSKIGSDSSGGAGRIAIPVLHHSLALDLAARAEPLRDFSAASDALTDGSPAAASPLDTQSFIDDAHAAYHAGVSMPLLKGVVLGVGYNTQDYRGGYTTTLGPNIAPRKDEYTASMRYTIPKTTTSISALVGNQHYTDYVLPTFNVDQNHESLNFSVKF